MSIKINYLNKTYSKISANLVLFSIYKYLPNNYAAEASIFSPFSTASSIGPTI